MSKKLKNIVRYALTCVFLFIVGTAAAQQTITGTIVDSTGEPVIGATVKEQGTTNAAVTDFDGNFSLSVSGKKPVEISYIGMKTKTVDVAGKSSINVTLEDEANDLNEVVVIGYGTVRKKDLTGAVAQVGAKEIENIPVAEVSQALQGKLSGVNVTIADGAPDIYDSLCDDCREHFEKVKSGLENLGFTYKIDKRLVRGLDYYTKTAYEILSGDLGAQNAVAGGGRYDNLANAIGGSKIPGVGFACGLDRVVLVMQEQNCSFGKIPVPAVYIVASDDASKSQAQLLTHKLRSSGIFADCDIAGRSFKNQMRNASNCNLSCVISNNICEVKNSIENSKFSFNLDEAFEYLKNNSQK